MRIEPGQVLPNRPRQTGTHTVVLARLVVGHRWKILTVCDEGWMRYQTLVLGPGKRMEPIRSYANFHAAQADWSVR
ncbi:MAG TPA: hypothetical protein VKD72_28840 [Gemmataceae bacterium]|nr:hypothetical protein [Gemmataceae bacterium]